MRKERDLVGENAKRKNWNCRCALPSLSLPLLLEAAPLVTTASCLLAIMKKMMVTKKEKPYYNKNHDLRCQTKAIARVFKEMSQENKNIVEEMRFGGLAHVPEMNVSHKLLRELIRCYDDYHGYFDILYGRIYITPAKIRDALVINYGGDGFSEKVEYNKLTEEQKGTIDNFKGATLASLTKFVLDMSIEEEENRQKFKRTVFIVTP
ncbi:uncharacterized protein [Arachis hypogaea]|nr:uncharacterized protein LOC112703149 [Arachis hypogaea]QHO28454.1 uncharacterized protein DS421_7g216820 [Arachis hypogaea]